MTTGKEYVAGVFEKVKAQNAHEPEFLQAVEEVFESLVPVFDKYPKSKMIADNMIEKMTEPSIKELINAYPVTLVSQKRKQLLRIFLKEKVNLLTRLRKEVYGE